MKLPRLLCLFSAVFSATAAGAADPAPAAGDALDWPDVPGILARISEPRFPARRFDITAYGARAGAAADCLPAIRRAIEACAAAGGGHVIVPPGTFLVAGPIRLVSQMDLHLEAGSTLRFSGRPADFLPVVLTRWEGVIIHGYSPLIYARGAENIAVTGSGTIDGNARREFTGWRQLQAGDEKRVFALGAAGAPLRDRDFGAGTHLRPSLLQPYECRNVLIAGVTLVDAPFWVVHPVFCRNVTVRGVTVDSLTINNDGCDPDSCTDVLIEDCRFHTGDDGIAIKAGRDRDAWADGRPTENVVIRGCRFSSRINALCIGSEMSAGVRHVFMEDCLVAEAGSCLYFKSNRDRGGAIENVRVRRIRVDVANSALIRFETNYHYYGGGQHSAAYRDFVLEDVTCAAAKKYAVFAVGTADSPIRGLTLRRVTVAQAAEPLYLRNVEGARFEQVSVDGKLLSARPAMTPDGTPQLALQQ